MQQMFVFLPSSHHSVHKFNYIHLVYFLSVIFIYHRFSTFFSTFLLPRQFLSFPSPFIYLKFPSNLFFACLIQSSKIHYHFLSINLLYMFSNFALPYFPTSEHCPCHSTWSLTPFLCICTQVPRTHLHPVDQTSAVAPWLSRLIAWLSQRRPEFNSRPFLVRLVLKTAVLLQAFLRVIAVSPCSITAV
jgi:hypothetical protein